MSPRELEKIRKLFMPESIAVVGASRDPSKIGGAILRNIIANGFKGRVYAVNPASREIMGVPSYPRLSDIPDRIDHVVVSVPADKVIEVIREAGELGVPVASVIAAGFKEVGRVDLEKQLVETARKYGMRVLGPNIFGVVYTPSNLNATFGPERVLPGKIAFLTQSGALGIALMSWTVTEGIGLSSIVSLGNMADLDMIELGEFFAEDPNTRVITMYIEGIAPGRGQEFVRVYKEVTRRKPVIALKAGRSERGTRAIASHTGSLAGADTIYDAVFRQTGILRANDVQELFDWAKAFASLERVNVGGKGFVILTNGGGIGVMATDASVHNELPLLEMPEDLKAELRKHMPWFGSAANPVDLTGQARTSNYAGALEALLKHPDVSGVVVLYCEVAFLDPVDLAHAIASVVREHDANKPVVISMVGGERTKEAMRILDSSGVPSYPIPERAVRSIATVYRYSQYLRKVGLVKPLLST